MARGTARGAGERAVRRLPSAEVGLPVKAPIDRGPAGSRVALGLRPHSGWAALVVVGGPRRAPQALERHRLELADAGIPGSKQPYHAAEATDRASAADFVDLCVASARRLARQGLRDVVHRLRKGGHDVLGCGVLTGRGEGPLPPLATILASHARIHAAEGRLFRDLLVEAGEGAGLAVTRVVEKELLSEASARLGLPLDEVQTRIAEMGRPLGPPWRQDEKYAALVGWMALP